MYSAWLQHRWLFSGVRFCLNNVPLGKFTKCVFFSYYSSFSASVLLQGAASCSDRPSFQFRALLYNGRASLFGSYFLSVATPATPNFSPFSALLTETDGADRARLRVPPVSGAPFFLSLSHLWTGGEAVYAASQIARWAMRGSSSRAV